MPRKPTTCGYPGCGIELPDHRPYSGSGLLSATEIVNFANLGSAKDAFAWAASEIAATTAVHVIERAWSDDSKDCKLDHKVCMACGETKAAHAYVGPHPAVNIGHKFQPGLCSICKLLRFEFKKRWDEKADKGTHVHHLAVNWAKGEPITADVSLDPYFDDLELFYKTYHPKWLYVERSIHGGVAGQREWVGTFDAVVEIDCPVCGTRCPRCTSPRPELHPAMQSEGEVQPCPDPYHQGEDTGRCVWLVDIKTGSKWEMEWRLQFSAYMFAKSITRWEDGKEIVERPMPLLRHAGALWLDGDPNDPCWTRAPRPLVPLQVDQEVHNMFLRLCELTTWEKREAKAMKARDKHVDD